MSESQSPDALKKLVWIMICLAVVGTIVALAIYYAVVLPDQQVAAGLVAPTNGCMWGSYHKMC